MQNVLQQFFFVLLLTTGIIACNSQGDSAEEEQLSTDLVDNPLSSGDDAEVTKLPEFTFEKESYDFGTITQGEKVEFSFSFKNTGDADLIISTASGSCGCTVPEWPKKPIPPGGEGVIDVVFDSEGKSGTQHKTVTVMANTQPNRKRLTVTGNIVAPQTNQNPNEQ